MARPLFTLIWALGALGALAGPRPLLAQEDHRRIVIAGAASLVPAAEKFSAGFRERHRRTEIEIRAGGSNYAVEAVRLGKIDVGLVTRDLSDPEKASFYAQSIGRDAIILLSYPGNPVSNLSLPQIRSIYQGKTTDWREVGGEKKGIVPLTRDKSSALRTIFLQRVFGRGFDGQEKAFAIRASKEKILRTIKRVEGSLGYGIVSPEEAGRQGVTVLAVDGKLPTAADIHSGSYALTRPQFLIFRSRPSGALRDWMLGFAEFAAGGHAQGDRR